MKYLVNNLVINSDQIVIVDYAPAHASQESIVRITLTSTEATYNKDGWPVGSTGQCIELSCIEADLFWDAYSSDAYTVISPKRLQAA